VWQKALAFQRDQTGSVTSVVYTDESGNTMTASKVEPPQASKAEPSQASNVEPSQPSPVWPWALAALVVLAIPTIWFIYRKRTKPQ